MNSIFISKNYFYIRLNYLLNSFLYINFLYFFLFKNHRHSLKAISCIVAAFDIMRSNSKSFTKESEDFMRQWVNFKKILNCFLLN